ncbi:MAG: MFS transporter [Pseudomonadota bacterium]
MDAPKSQSAIASETQPGAEGRATSPRARRVGIALLLAGAVCAGMGQTIIFSILPPFARELGLSNMEVGAMFMTGATFFVIAGPYWGRWSDRVGRKPFLMVGFMGLTVSLFTFGWAIRSGLSGALSGGALFAFMMFTRCIYGVFGSAGSAATNAYIADRTSASDRTAGLAAATAAFGLGAMIGPGFGSALGVLGPAAPLFAIAALALASTIALYLFLPERSRPVERKRAKRMTLFDSRYRQFLLFGLGFGVISAVPIQTIGFYFIDALEFETDIAAQFAGVALMSGAMASLFSQLVVVQRFRTPPNVLMRLAPVLGIIGSALIAVGGAFGPVIFGMMLVGFGTGLAVPGYASAASLSVDTDEQGGVIGLVNSSKAAGFIVAPVIGFNLYDISPQAPFIFCAGLGLALMAFAMLSRAIANARPEPDAEPPLEAVERPASAPYQ